MRQIRRSSENTDVCIFRQTFSFHLQPLHQGFGIQVPLPDAVLRAVQSAQEEVSDGDFG